LVSRISDLESHQSTYESRIQELMVLNTDLLSQNTGLVSRISDLESHQSTYESRIQELTVLNAELISSNSEVRERLMAFAHSRAIRMLSLIYRVLGLGNRGLAAELKRSDRLLKSDSMQPIQPGRLVMAWKFLRVAMSRPFLTIRLMHPRRIKNASLFLVFNKGNLSQLYKRYREIYAVDLLGNNENKYIPVKPDSNKKVDAIFIFPLIDWSFRHQRPQHLSTQLGKLGYRLFYFTTTPLMENGGPPYRIIDNPGNNVFVCQLRGHSKKIDDIYHEQMDERVRSAYSESLFALMDDMNIQSSITILHHCYWKPLADIIPDTLIGYDCMDHHAGFQGDTSKIPDAEKELIRHADFVVTSSSYLNTAVSKIRPNTLIRNGCEYSFFDAEREHLVSDGPPVAGYVGAIAEWFDIDLVVYAASSLPDWRFILVGSTVGCDISKAKNFPNIEFIGEVKYEKVPYYVQGFDVCLIPFRIIELTKATNPVKVYEYLSAGKPVVTTALLEMKLIEDEVFIAHNPQDFVVKLKEAKKVSSDETRIDSRKKWASCHDWSSRGKELENAMLGALPLVSIIVLTYNNLVFTKACLESITNYTYYPNYEVIIVDNGSEDGSRDYIRNVVKDKPNWRLIANERNLGFAAGNNVGIISAKGDFIVLLNNDTYVSPGWLKNLIRPFAVNPRLALAGPVTNNIGNEAKIDIAYNNMAEMIERSRNYTIANVRKILFVSNVAFFCVAIPRHIIDEIGLLDERFGIGFFDDDDYSRRVKEAGYEIAIVEDSFVHHHLSASFDQLQAERRQQLFEENKKLFEAKWGPWKPHKYR
jgi:GT2 family glycosyltransferase/glycosyltransferase involved in cell wall biosynthesis/uncharacterized protein YeeX (DUF496 family)